MKKQKIKKSLSFNKEIIIDLKSIKGGNYPATGSVETYRCGPTFGGSCGSDPVPNPSTCDAGGGTLRDTLSMCSTLVGSFCVEHSLNIKCAPGDC